MKEDQGDQETPLLEEQYAKMKRSENRLFRSIDIPQEDRMTGTVSFKLYWDYLRAGAHPVALAGLLLIFILCQGNVEHTKNMIVIYGSHYPKALGIAPIYINAKSSSGNKHPYHYLFRFFFFSTYNQCLQAIICEKAVNFHRQTTVT